MKTLRFVALSAFSLSNLLLLTLFFSLGAAVVVPSSLSYAQQPSPTQRATPTQGENKLPNVVTPTDSSVKETLTDASFLEKSAASLLNNSELSKIVVKKSKNAKLKEFAQSVVQQSESSLKKVNQVAATEKISVPTKLSPDQHSTIDQLQALNGQDFDLTYANLVQKSQDILVGLYDNAVGETKLKKEVRQLAADDLPQLRQHQKVAHSLSQPAPTSIK